MANIEDLGYRSISEMTTEEALELLRQIRLSRRMPVKKVRTMKKGRSVNLTPEQARNILKMIEEE